MVRADTVDVACVRVHNRRQSVAGIILDQLQSCDLVIRYVCANPVMALALALAGLVLKFERLAVCHELRVDLVRRCISHIAQTRQVQIALFLFIIAIPHCDRRGPHGIAHRKERK
jgi:hypothetical protein